MPKTVDARSTPMMQQYLAAKAEHPDALLLMRMGDFYECFLDDAVEIARLLGITLTSRNKGSDDEVPMAGVPHHSLQGHLTRLLESGRKVAIMDQLEDPATAKGLVKRGLTRIHTPGTLIDEDALDAGAANLLVAITGLDGLVGVAALDVSTGRFTVEDAEGPQQVALALARLEPAELVLPEALFEAADRDQRLGELCGGVLPPLGGLPAFAWHQADAARTLCDHLAVARLDGFGIHESEGHLAAAAAAALRYASQHAFDQLAHIRSLHRLHRGAHLVIDAVCRRNLELLRNNRDHTRHGTLVQAVDRCRSAPGSRLLADWLTRPLAAVEPIVQRQDAVALFHDHDALRADLREALEEVYDLERLLARVATGRCNGRDLIQLATSLEAAAACAELLTAVEAPLSVLVAEALPHLRPAPELAGRLTAELVEQPPLTIGEGGIFRDGVDPELDELRMIKKDAGAWLARYQAVEAERSGIPKIKVGYNKVFGYYLEVTKGHSDRVPAYFVRKQTLVNAERYITPELKEYEDKVLGAEDRIRALEQRRFEALRQEVEGLLPVLQKAAEALALLDVTAALAEVARRENWNRPLVDDGQHLDLQACRHPVVERVIGRGAFVANDCALLAGAGDGPRLGLITGPNMAGKSTYIRQVALAVILAQAGSFIPAESARIGLVDRLFTRIGAGDELAQGMSTFMVEMAETAAILNNASERSLVILDEVGRGTSTFDGVSLAWAITEHLHDRLRCRCLFATHYHELCDLASERSGICNLTVAVAEQDDTVAFLHRIVPGAAAKSYGIHVARLAGVPGGVIARAREVLATLERINVDLTDSEAHTGPDTIRQQAVQLSLFQAPQPSPTLLRLRALQPDDLSPRQAHDLLYELIRAAGEEMRCP